MKILAFALTALLSGSASAENASPAQEAIRRAEKLMAAQPHQPQLHLLLAQAWVRRALETGSPAHYDQAEAALAPALILSPENLTIRKLQIEILLGIGHWREALEITLPLHRKMLDDVDLYGYLTDAYIALGDYGKAEESAQWMLDLRPANVAGLLRAARLRELFGDLEGAIDFFNRTALGVGADQPEMRVLMLSEIARILLAQERTEQAEAVLDQALKMSPLHQAALRQLAALRQRQKRWPEALAALRRRQENGASPQSLFELAAALSKAGQMDEAGRLFAEFESAALGRGDVPVELVSYYADFASRPSQALDAALRRARERRDVDTRRALARALVANGRHEEALKEIEAALAVGIRDPETRRLASQIREAVAAKGRRQEADSPLL